MIKKPTYEDKSKTELINEIEELNKEIANLKEGKTDHKLFENAGSDNESMYKDILNKSSDLIFRTNKNNMLTFISPSVFKLTGYTVEESVMKMSVVESYVNINDRTKLINELKINGHVENFEAELKHKDGSHWWALTNAYSIKDKDGNMNGVEGLVRDITKLKLAEEELIIEKNSQRSLLAGLDRVGLGVDIVDADYRIKFQNSLLQKRFGDLTDKLCYENYMGLDAPCSFCMMKKVIAENTVEKLELTGADGRDYELTSALLPVRKGITPSVVEVVQDITDRKKIERDLIKEIAFNKTILDAAPAYFVSIDKHGNLININKSMLNALGYETEELEGQNYLNKLVPLEDHESLNKIFEQLIKEKKNTYNINKVLTKSGKEIVVGWYGAPILDENGKFDFFLGFGIDITEKQKLEHQLQQSHKMEAIGTLAGGIAHDFNNMLGVIISNTEMILDKKDENEKDELFDILTASKRAKDLVNQILTFSRKSQQSMSPVDIAKITEETINFIRLSIPSTIKIKSNIENKNGMVFGNASQVNQVIMNLCTNASYAMKETGGILGVELKKTILDKYSSSIAGLKPGVYQHLIVSDTGSGMDKDVAERIFEPFYTTKNIGEGTGMGLSVAYGIVKDHKGEIKVYSEKEKGTSFNVYFPLSEIDVSDNPDIDNVSLPMGNMERILFVDDEPMISKVSTEMLKNLDYSVESRTSSIEALQFFKSQPDSFDLLITDMTMPDMNGIILAKEVHKIKPDIPVILCTGFNKTINGDKNKAEDINTVLEKPFELEELATAIRSVLDKNNFSSTN